MKSSKIKTKEEKKSGKVDESLDPFAGDFFGGLSRGDLDENDKANGKKSSKSGDKLSKAELEALHWFKDLPKLSYQELNFSNQFLALPFELSSTAQKVIQQVFSGFTKLEEKLIDCKLQSVSEVQVVDALENLNKSPKLFLKIESNPKIEAAILAFNNEFASALVDLVLGGKGDSPNKIKALSAIEQAIIEFIAINVLGQFNQTLDDYSFSLLSVENEVNNPFNNKERGAEILLKFAIGEVVGEATLLLISDFFNEINLIQDSIFEAVSSKEKLVKYEKISNDLATNILMGETQVNGNDILYLEKGDVILVEKPVQNLDSNISVFVGDSTNYQLRGKLHNLENDEEFDQEIIFEITEIFSEKEKQSQPRRKKMDKKKQNANEESSEETVSETGVDSKEIKDSNTGAVDEKIATTVGTAKQIDEEIDESALASLENVMINLRVNLGGRRLSLSELQKVKIGQIIDLACSPNDPVEIVTDSDNRPIATGELIEIEGNIGVRLTKVFV